MIFARINPDQLKALASAAKAGPCKTCAPLVCPGWETLQVTFDRTHLKQVGTLVDEAIEDPTVEEHHPGGTHSWSANAPIAVAFFPYNRCGVWQCVACERLFLRYTEYGGYYLDERIRAVDALLIDESPVGAAP